MARSGPEGLPAVDEGSKLPCEAPAPPMRNAHSMAGLGPPAKCPPQLHAHTSDALPLMQPRRPSDPRPREPRPPKRSSPAAAGTDIAGCSEAAVPSGSFDALMRAAVADVRNIVKSSSWDVVNCAEMKSHEQALEEIRPKSAGVVIVPDPRDQAPAIAFVEFLVQREIGVGIVVFLLHQPSEPFSVSTHLRAQRRFQVAGADDVVFQGTGGSGDMRVALGMGMQRAEWRCGDQVYVSEMIARHANEIASNSQMFWGCVHRVFTGFPKLSAETPECMDRDKDKLVQVGATWLQRILSTGAPSSVYAGVNKETGQREAVKVVKKSALTGLGAVAKVWHEFACLSKVCHPNIARLYSVSHTHRFIAMHFEYAGSVTLLAHLASRPTRWLDMDEVWGIGAQLASALEYCHSVGVAHRDVKLASVVMPRSGDSCDRSAAKLVGFGMAVEVRAQACDTRCGTMPFCAPERLEGAKATEDGVCKDDGRQSLDPLPGDVWALGVVLLEMFAGLGVTCKIFGWPESIVPSHERADEIRRRLAPAGALAQAIKAHSTRCDEQAEGDVFSRDAAVSLIASAMDCSTRTRCRMSEASAQLRKLALHFQVGVRDAGEAHRRNQPSLPSSSSQRVPTKEVLALGNEGSSARGSRPSIAKAEAMVADALLTNQGLQAPPRKPAHGQKPGSNAPDGGPGWRGWTVSRSKRNNAAAAATCDVLSPMVPAPTRPAGEKPEGEVRPAGYFSRRTAAVQDATSPRGASSRALSSSSQDQEQALLSSKASSSGAVPTKGSLEPVTPRSPSPSPSPAANRRGSREGMWPVGNVARWLTGRAATTEDVPQIQSEAPRRPTGRDFDEETARLIMSQLLNLGGRDPRTMSRREYAEAVVEQSMRW
mmetsp:Transcript_68040/g.197047  ORF Transcript_68040/g.197047 Transcript_68040/m.197047 type:complete len:880 (-) Transcript_68040:250-2889(-)